MSYMLSFTEAYNRRAARWLKKHPELRQQYLKTLALLQANNLESVQLPGEKGTGDQVKFWRAVQYISFIGAGIYVVLVLVFLKRIRIAIILMEESSKAFQANPMTPILAIIGLLWVTYSLTLGGGVTQWQQIMEQIQSAQ